MCFLHRLIMCKNNRGIRIKSGLSNRSKPVDSSASSLTYLCRSSSPLSSSLTNCDHHHHHHNNNRNHHPRFTNNNNNWNDNKFSDCDPFNCDNQLGILNFLIKSTFNNQSTLNYKHYGLISLLSILLYLNTINADFAYDDR